MIFVTVGTHEQPFNRLIQKIDELKKDGTIQDDVIIQTGFSTYEPKYCQWSKLIPYQQMVKNVADARIVITHGGPASFIMPLQIGKTPIVVPRQHLEYFTNKYNHRDDFFANGREVRNFFERAAVNQANRLAIAYGISGDDIAMLTLEDVEQA